MMHVGIAAALASACLAQAQTITIEVDFAGGSPDGAMNVVPIFDPQMLDVWIYADQPGVRVSSILFDLDGRRAGPSGGQFGAFRVLSGPGAIDPDGALSSLSVLRDVGAVDGDGLGIGGIALAGLPLPGLDAELGVGPGGAMRLYAGVEAQAESFAALFRADRAVIMDGVGAAVSDVRTIGVMQIPGPGTAGVLVVGGLVGVRRRR